MFRRSETNIIVSVIKTYCGRLRFAINISGGYRYYPRAYIILITNDKSFARGGREDVIYIRYRERDNSSADPNARENNTKSRSETNTRHFRRHAGMVMSHTWRIRARLTSIIIIVRPGKKRIRSRPSVAEACPGIEIPE